MTLKEWYVTHGNEAKRYRRALQATWRNADRASHYMCVGRPYNAEVYSELWAIHLKQCQTNNDWLEQVGWLDAFHETFGK